MEKRLHICYEDNEDEDLLKKIEFELYGANYISALRHIVRNAKLPGEEADIFLREMRNILVFIGGRGSGKTTAMTELREILKSMDKEEKRDWWMGRVLENQDEERMRSRSFKFYTTDPIDASLLDGTDNLFELILVNIYQIFKEDIERCVKSDREQMKKAGNVVRLFRDVVKFYHKTENCRTENALESESFLESMTGSYAIGKKIGDLVDSLIELKNSEYDYKYIVITIDDLDLNLGYGYEMLELLQKYFRYHKIIVLAAIDFEQMSLVCEKHFEQQMSLADEIYKRNSYRHNRELVHDYLTKVFPFSQRLFMPDARKVSNKIFIELSERNKGKEKVRRISVKNYIMGKIAAKMRIFYDGCGLKRHFCELEKVREIVVYNDFLDSLHDIKFDKLKDSKEKRFNKEQLKKYDQNYEWFNHDILTRVARHMLNPQQNEVFQGLVECDLRRRAAFFAGMDDGKGELSLNRVIREKEYTYGELLEKMYKWGRKSIDFKPLISCCLAFFTSEMVREYMHYCYSENGEKNKENLIGFLGNSFGNTWCGSVLKQVSVGQQKDIGYVRDIAQSHISITISIDQLYNIKDCRNDSELKSAIKTWISEECIIETLECIDMFFVRREKYSYEGVVFHGEIKFDAASGEEQFNGRDFGLTDVKDKVDRSHVRKYLQISGQGKPVTWDIMAFVPKSLDYVSQKKRLQDNIRDVLLTGIMDVITSVGSGEASKDIVTHAVDEAIKEKSMFSDGENNYKKYKAAYPFYDLDMSYNIWKRVRRQPQVVQGDGIYDAIRACYKNIEECLEQEKNFYAGMPDGEKTFGYLDDFKNSPYINKFCGGESADSEEKDIQPWVSDKVKQQLTEVYKRIVIVSKPPQEAGDKE